MTRATAQRRGPFGMFRVPSAAEKEALARGLRVGAAGIALLLLVPVVGLEYAWIIALLLGLGLVAYGALALRRALGVRSWLRVRGRVVASFPGEVAIPGRVAFHTHYYPVVRFEYATPNGRFTSDRYAIAPQDPRSLDVDEIRALLAPYPEGAEIDAYVDPRNHALAVVHPQVSRPRRSQYMAAIVGGLLVCAFTLWAALPPL